MSEFAFILGNGKTRLDITPGELSACGRVYACNRIYNEFTPDVLVSTDAAMAREIQESGYSENNLHYTRESNIIRGSGARALMPDYTGFSSGPNAIALAAAEGVPYIFLIGFDLVSETTLINNIYSGTANYATSDALSTSSDNWVNQIYEIAEKYKNQRFIHVNPLIGYTPESWETLANFEAMDLTGFRSMLNI